MRPTCFIDTPGLKGTSYRAQNCCLFCSYNCHQPANPSLVSTLRFTQSRRRNQTRDSRLSINNGCQFESYTCQTALAVPRRRLRQGSAQFRRAGFIWNVMAALHSGFGCSILTAIVQGHRGWISALRRAIQRLRPGKQTWVSLMTWTWMRAPQPRRLQQREMGISRIGVAGLNLDPFLAIPTMIPIGMQVA